MFNRFTIGKKLLVGFGLCVIVIGLIVIFNYSRLQELRVLQDEGAQRAKDAIVITEAAYMGPQMYRVIADAIINRDMQATTEGWNVINAEAIDDLEIVLNIVDTNEERELLKQAQNAHESLVEIFENELLPTLKTGGNDEATMKKIRELDEVCDSYVQGMIEPMEKIMSSLSAESAEADEVYDSKAQATINVSIIVALIGIALATIIGVLIARAIVKPIQRVVDQIKDIAEGEGDLTKRINYNAGDEVGDLATWFDKFIDKLHDIISQVKQNTEQLASASTEVSSSAEQLSSGASEQTNQTAQVSTAIEQMTATIMESSKNTADAAAKAAEAAAKSQEGSRLAEDTSRGMDDIVSSTSITAQNIMSLADKATAIGEIIKVIDDIADQTNLLALNAAIEAARAGEQGRGFAVVADEVRKLAERTTKATKEVAETIKGIQTDVSAANNQMTDSSGIVDKGKELVHQTSSSLNEIYSAIESVQEMMRQLASASDEQSSAAEQISKNVENVDRISKEAATGAEQAASASEELNRQAEELRILVGGFKLRQDIKG